MSVILKTNKKYDDEIMQQVAQFIKVLRRGELKWQIKLQKNCRDN